MKSNFKIFTVAIAAIMTFGSAVLISCDKESQNSLFNESSLIAVKTQSNPISNFNNPYDYLGLLHNEALDTVLLNSNGDNLLENAHEKIGDFVISKFPLSTFTTTTFEESMMKSNQGYEIMTNILLKTMTVDELGYDNELVSAIEEMYGLCDSMIAKNTLFTPNDFAKKIKEIEAEILSYSKHNVPDYSTGNTVMNQYDNVLASLAIARYSYAYWYDVATNVSNPLHGGFGNTPSYECCPPLKNLWNAIVNVAEEVANVAVTVWADISSGETVILYDELGHEIGRTTTWALDAAVNASATAYNTRQNQ